MHSRRYAACNYMLAIIVLLYSLSIVHLACRWNMVRRAFIIDAGAWDTTLQSFLHQPTWSIVLSSLSLSLMTLIADSVLVSACTSVLEVWLNNIDLEVLDSLEPRLESTDSSTSSHSFGNQYAQAASSTGRDDNNKFEIVFCAISLANQIMPQSRLFTSNRARFSVPS